jgi:hypothetical protein
MSIVTVHGPYTFGSKAITEVGAAVATLTPPQTDGLKWTFRTDQPSTRTASLVWTFPTGTPATATGPGPIAVTFASAGTKAVTAVATGVGEGANPYPPAGTTNLPVTAVSGTGPPGTSLLMAPEEGGEEYSRTAPDDEDVEVGYDPAAHTVTEVIGFVEDHPEELEDVIATEEAGKARVTLLTHLESMREA